MTSDHRVTPGLIHDILDALERHGYYRSDDLHADRAIGLIGDLAGIYEGTQDHPRCHSQPARARSPVLARRRPGGRPVTPSRRKPDEPARRPAAPPLIPDPRPGERDMPETTEPYDLPFPDGWPPGRPEYVIVVDQLRDWRPGQPPSLAELLEAGPARTREPEPDLEAEP